MAYNCVDINLPRGTYVSIQVLVVSSQIAVRNDCATWHRVSCSCLHLSAMLPELTTEFCFRKQARSHQKAAITAVFWGFLACFLLTISGCGHASQLVKNARTCAQLLANLCISVSCNQVGTAASSGQGWTFLDYSANPAITVVQQGCKTIVKPHSCRATCKLKGWYQCTRAIGM